MLANAHSCGETVKIKALPCAPGNSGWTFDLCIFYTVALNLNKTQNPICYGENKIDFGMNETAKSCSLDQSFPLMECRVILDDILSECGTEKFQTASVPSDKPHKSHCCHTDENCLKDTYARAPVNWAKPFPSSSLKYKDFLTLLATRRNASSSGLNSIPYKVYKKCPQINTFLFNVFKSCLKNCVVPIQWRYAREIFIPKCKTPMESNIKDVRPIALLNASFFSVLYQGVWKLT